jgi:hypothetical protein
MKGLRLFRFFVLLTFLPACRMVPESDAGPDGGEASTDGVSVVAVQYVASVSWPFSEFTNPLHFMV